MNNKRVQRLWRAEGLKVPYRKRKRALRGTPVVGAMSALAPNAVWALDFQFDQTTDARPLEFQKEQGGNAAMCTPTLGVIG